MSNSSTYHSLMRKLRERDSLLWNVSKDTINRLVAEIIDPPHRQREIANAMRTYQPMNGTLGARLLRLFPLMATHLGAKINDPPQRDEIDIYDTGQYKINILQNLECR